MNKLSTLLAALLILLSCAIQTAFAQTPEKISYQAVVRDAGNNLVTSQPVGIQISILQESANGMAVYTETQTPTSNTNGLIAIEIGNGTVVSGDFSTINWENGPYFLKTEIDPDGGTNYNITGTIQLLSVPYALHSKTAETITDETMFEGWDKNESDDFDGQYSNLSGTPVNVSEFVNDAGYVTVFSEIDGDTTNELQTISRSGLAVTLSNGGGTYTDSVNVYTAGDGIQITNNTISLENKHYVGELYGGGIVFYVDHTGEHGLIASLNDQDDSNGANWSDVTNMEIGAEAHCYYNGTINTDAIISQQTATSAAQLCRNLGAEWYLPSTLELDKLYSVVFIINNILENDEDDNTYGITIGESAPYGRYWSSNEYSNNLAWYFEFREGRIGYFGKNSAYRVRAIKSF